MKSITLTLLSPSLAMLGLLSAGFSLVMASGGYSPVEVRGLPIAAASLVQSGLSTGWASVVVAPGL